MMKIDAESKTPKTFYFAGGGTGGHIYPALAVAEEIQKRNSQAKIIFFCSDRAIDIRILSATNFQFIPLPAKPFGKTPIAIWQFCRAFRQSRKIVKEIIGNNKTATMIITGGFTSAPAAITARNCGMKIFMVNVDAIPGKANKLLMRLAKKVFIQFEMTTKYCGQKAILSGAPLREAFKTQIDRNVMAEKLGLSPKKKTLLLTGASSGAVNINSVTGFLLNKLDSFAGEWQIVHLTGIIHYDSVRTTYKNAKIGHKILDYCDDMPGVLAFADLVIGRGGAMSIAEFAVSQTPAICMPYPYHCDNHQKINAAQSAKAGCCEIVEDLCDTEKTSRLLWSILAEMMGLSEKLRTMRLACEKFARPDATAAIVDVMEQ